MQARALAAQAAHQRRFAASMDATAGQAVASALDRQSHNTVLRSAFDSDGTPPFHPSAIIEDSGDLMDEMQVDLALMVDTPEAGFTSLTASVDISAFMPPPGPPVLIANDATIAASACPLSDWAADLTWTLINRYINPFATDYSSWHEQVFNGSIKKEVVPQAFRTFASATLAATLPSTQCLFLGILYLSKLPIGRAHAVPPELNNASTPPGIIALFQNLNFTAWTGHQAVFRKSLYGPEMNALGLDAAINVGKLAFSLALMLGNKWLEDNTFTTRTWYVLFACSWVSDTDVLASFSRSEVTTLPQANLKALETDVLKMFGFNMVIRDQEWIDWLGVLRSYTSNLVAKEPIGMVSGANTKALARIDELAMMGCNHHCEPSAIPDWPMDSPMQVSVALMADDDDMVLVPVQAAGGPRRRGHSRTTSLPFAPGYDSNFVTDAAPFGLPPFDLQYATYNHRPAAFGYERSFNPWARGDHVDAFQSAAPHPAVVNASIEARRRAQQAQPVYRWDQVLAEMAAQEREQENVTSAWPRPSRFDWTCSARPAPALVGV